jgi:hypothetical protein
MPEQPTGDLQKWHRHFAGTANNRAWTLCEQSGLTPEDHAELLDAAHAAAYHWRAIGTPAQIAHANLLLGRTHALLGHGTLAMHYAIAAFEAFQAGDAAPWERAFAHAILANAAAAADDSALHAQHYAEAQTLGESLTDPEDRQIFAATFKQIPAPGAT